MAANGFIDVTINGEDAPDEEDFSEEDGVWRVDGELVVYGIYCGLCHDPHPDEGEEMDYQLRAPEEEICELCHYNTHEFPDTHVRHGTTEFRNGLNGKDVPVIEYMPEVSCPECHMWASSGHGTPPVKVGHSFEWAPQACVECHSMYSNESAEAYVDAIHSQYNDWVTNFGDGETSGILFEVEERKAWAMANDLWDEDTNMTYLEAEWNYAYPTQDGSMGAHNPEFMVAMFESSMEKFEMVLDNTEMGGVEGTLTWDNDDAIEGAVIKDGSGATMDTTDADGMYFFWADSGVKTFLVYDADGDLVGSINTEVTTMQNVTKDVTFEKPTSGGGGGDDEEETDTMTYVFIGIIVLLIIILIVVAMMGKKE
jgi:hypothetical protein